MTSLLVGGYGPDMEGAAVGITLADARDGGIDWASGPACASPSWLAARGEVLVAALEGQGALAWFRRDGADWVPDGVTELGGTLPCHVAFLDDETVAVACYGDGAIVLACRGERAPLQRIDGEGSGPLPAQDGPHAHHVHVLPDSRVLTLDLGADRMHVHLRGEDGLLTRVASVELPAGTGPRDLHALGGGRLAVLGEWSSEVVVLEPAGDGFGIAQRIVLPGATPAVDQAAALGVSGDGRFLYAGIRRADRVGVLEITDAGLQGVGWVPSGRGWPRHLMVDGDLLHVANQLGNEVTTFRIGADGIPQQLWATAMPAPTCVIRAPEPLLS